jgi:hypothetical protein
MKIILYDFKRSSKYLWCTINNSNKKFRVFNVYKIKITQNKLLHFNLTELREIFSQVREIFLLMHWRVALKVAAYPLS